MLFCLKKKVLNNNTNKKENQEENLINYRVNTLGKFLGSLLTMHIDCNLCIVTPTDLYTYTHTTNNNNNNKKGKLYFLFTQNEKHIFQIFIQYGT